MWTVRLRISDDMSNIRILVCSPLFSIINSFAYVIYKLE